MRLRQLVPRPHHLRPLRPVDQREFRPGQRRGPVASRRVREARVPCDRVRVLRARVVSLRAPDLGLGQAEPGSDVRPGVFPGEAAGVADVEFLVGDAWVRGEGEVFFEVGVQVGGADRVVRLPAEDVAGELEGGFESVTDGSVDREGESKVHGGVGDGAQDRAGHGNGPRGFGVGGAMFEQDVFLAIVKIGFVCGFGDSGLRLDGRLFGGTEMSPVVLRARLEHDTLW